jgi:hypothetical protein
MKKFSVSLDIREIKAKVRFHFTPVRMAIIKIPEKQQMLVGMWEKWNT